MMNGTNGMLIDPMQSMRIAEHPIQIKENLIIFDNLEAETLRIYEQMNGPVSVQQLFTRYKSIRNAALVAEIIINSQPKGPTTSSAGGMGKPPWGKTFAFPPKGGLTNQSFLLVGRLKAALF